jgi:hypothetical protein
MTRAAGSDPSPLGRFEGLAVLASIAKIRLPLITNAARRAPF